jgi:hypothetical protein
LNSAPPVKDKPVYAPATHDNKNYDIRQDMPVQQNRNVQQGKNIYQSQPAERKVENTPRNSVS